MDMQTQLPRDSYRNISAPLKWGGNSTSSVRNKIVPLTLHFINIACHHLLLMTCNEVAKKETSLEFLGLAGQIKIAL